MHELATVWQGAKYEVLRLILRWTLTGPLFREHADSQTRRGLQIITSSLQRCRDPPVLCWVANEKVSFPHASDALRQGFTVCFAAESLYEPVDVALELWRLRSAAQQDP